jgi:hypothetical protein
MSGDLNLWPGVAGHPADVRNTATSTGTGGSSYTAATSDAATATDSAARAVVTMRATSDSAPAADALDISSTSSTPSTATPSVDLGALIRPAWMRGPGRDRSGAVVGSTAAWAAIEGRPLTEVESLTMRLQRAIRLRDKRLRAGDLAEAMIWDRESERLRGLLAKATGQTEVERLRQVLRNAEQARDVSLVADVGDWMIWDSEVKRLRRKLAAAEHAETVVKLTALAAEQGNPAHTGIDYWRRRERQSRQVGQALLAMGEDDALGAALVAEAHQLRRRIADAAAGEQ